MTPAALAAEAERLATEQSPNEPSVYYDGVYPTLKRALIGAAANERVDRLLQRAGRDPGLLGAARRTLEEQPESTSRDLAAAMLDLAIVRCEQ
jgi:hypothetical protein